MDLVNGDKPSVEVVKSTSCSPFTRRVDCLREIENRMNILREKNRQLIANTTDITRESQGAAEEHVLVLLEDAAMKVNVQVNVIDRSLQQKGGCVFDFWSPQKIVKHIVQVTQEVDRLLQETSQLPNEELVVVQSPPRGILLPATSLVGKSTVDKNLHNIFEALRDPMIGKIGIYGMGGSGKTTTVKNVNNELIKTKDFDKIIWITASNDLNLEHVQKEIANQLNLNLSTDADEVRRASLLFERLNHNTKFLIIVDDLWDWFPLEKVGIPEPTRENGCKIVLITRILAVCRDMETQTLIKLELLSNDEAWELFVSKVGYEEITLEVQPFAEAVVRKCEGLPSAIINVARALKGQLDIKVWKQAANDLQSSPEGIQGMEGEVLESLHVSYSHLRSDTVRKCFLYFTFFPADYEIEANELIGYWMAENFINEQDDLESNRDEGFKVFHQLVDTGLLEKRSYSATYAIRMHSVTRDSAITIMTTEGEKLMGAETLIKAGLDLVVLPQANKWYEARKISLVKNEIDVLPDQPSWPNLTTLLLRENPLSQKLSSSFFNEISSLEILDLSYTRLLELPHSLSNLVNLLALFLQGCKFLEKIPSLAKLKNLRMLNLSHTAIKELPQGMEGLISLASLDLSFTHHLEDCMIPKLTLLEELRMEGTKIWGMDSQTVLKCIKEIRNLDCLKILTLGFVRLDDYLNAIECLHWDAFKNFSIRISDSMDLFSISYNNFRPNFIYMRNQKMNSGSSALLFPPKIQELHMTLCDIPRLSESLCLRNLKFLTKCHIERCLLTSGDCLVLGDETEEHTLKSLEYLSLENVRGLEFLWKSTIPHASFSNLRVLEVHWCASLRKLFFGNLLNHLKNIEIINVSDCKLIEEIVACSDGEGHNDDSVNTTTIILPEIVACSDGEGHNDDSVNTTTIILPRLRTLILKDLPVLHTISSMILVCASLRHVEVFRCPKLKKFPFSDADHSIPNLEVIKGETVWWERLEWDDLDTKNFLQSRFKQTEQ